MQQTKKSSGRLTAAARRAQLIDVGRAVFAERGYEATSVEEIAARANVSKPVLYDHFGGKEGLYAVVVDREVERIVQKVAASVATGTPRARIENAALAYLTYVKEHPEGFAVLQRDTPTARGEMPALMYDLADRVSTVFTEQFSEGGYDAKMAPIYAHALVGMVAFVGQWWTDSRKPPPVETVANHIAALAWTGLRHLPKRPKFVE
ncbi:MAG: TetR/AcrR family transcriptional regulator [Gammaproteobacteria bacterium]|jgi:AcrR family transcriptional regulator|nr:TetR/AcrR family transcriptional regulator [Gammaproteobacteria bacterium]MDH3777312.1 TetR/AcrR family transcriptional regulator [Gammaproteobacteria bacterium]MDH3810628.1 TetR/AcrR family transcriptional regulator [Gammaproteobacteria bacterium]